MRFCRFIVSLLMLRMLLACAAAQASGDGDFRGMLDLLHISAEELEGSSRGHVVVHAIPENAHNEIALGMVVTVPQSADEVKKAVSQGKLLSLDPAIKLGEAMSAGKDGLEAFSLFAETDEALQFLEAERGDSFNLSPAELRQLHSLHRQENAPGKAVREDASRHYRDLLRRRWQSYRARGLAGIAPYARAEGRSDPAAELASAAKSHEFLNHRFPDLHQAWLKYPVPLRSGIVEEFRWLNRHIGDRPTPILLHWMAQAQPWGAVMVAREYYVGHSYNSSETLLGCLAYGSGSVIFYEVRSYTDQVSGLGSELKRGIGRQQLKEEMTQRLERLQDWLAR